MIEFRHPLMRSAILQTLGTADRRRAHGALARVLTGQTDRRAWHRAAACPGTDENVAVELESGGDTPQRRGAVRARSPHCRRRRG